MKQQRPFSDALEEYLTIRETLKVSIQDKYTNYDKVATLQGIKNRKSEELDAYFERVGA